MNSLTKIVISSSLIAVGVIATAAFLRPTPVAPAHAEIPHTDRVARGRYLVHELVMCIDCHSPRNEKGQFIEFKHLTGAPLPFAPNVPMPWMPVAPSIAGLPAGYTESDSVRFLMTGQRPNNKPAPVPPMPPFRMNRDDAEAITAYLASLSASRN